MSRMPFRVADPVGPSAGVHYWAALPSGVNVSCHEVNNAESGPSDANNQNENVSGTHIRPFRSQIGRTSVPGMVGGASSTRNQSSDECGRLILGYCMRGQSVIAPTGGGVIRIESGTDAVIGEAFGVPVVWGLFRRSSINHIYWTCPVMHM
jgi:hypothetical protein